MQTTPSPARRTALHRKPLLVMLALSLLTAAAAAAAGPPCKPCVGVRVTDPMAVTGALAAEPRLEGEARLYVAWPTALDGTADTAAFEAVRAAGGTPWLIVHFTTPVPVREHLDQLEAELVDLARLARAGGARAHFQVVWEAGAHDAQELAFLLKRAAVTVTGADSEARFLAGPFSSDPELLRELYGEEIAAYLDGVVLAPGDLEATIALLAELDPGKPVVVDSLPWPDQAARTLALAAEQAAAGVAVTLFDVPAELLAAPAEIEMETAASDTETEMGIETETEMGVETEAEAEIEMETAPGVDDGEVEMMAQAEAETEAGGFDLAPLKVLAREFQGDLSYDPYTVPTGAARAWTFVRGSDLGLRVVAESPPDAAQLQLYFDDNQLKSPTRVDLATGADGSLFGQRRTGSGLLVPIDQPGPVVLLRVERLSAEELEGVAEEVQVSDARQMPVEEILRRLQAFEDAQERRLDHYQAVNTFHLRFLVGSGAGSIEASYAGDFFFRRDQGFDWVWETLYVNGVKWKGEQLPEIPLLQPEKAAARPLEIHLSKEYSYRLRGTAVVDGRDCWVVDFEPLEVTPGSGLYQGTVWVDREIYARVRTRALQLGLEGDVLSNEETTTFTPITENGQPAPWSSDSYVLPTRVVGQQLLSLLNSTVPVETETALTDIRINRGDFDQAREQALASDHTMVRDTDKGMRYLIKDESGERVVEEEVDTDRLFIAGGAFYDETLDYPLPLAGLNYLALDFKDTGNQVNVFFAGVLLTANIAQPRLFGSRWDAGANLFGFFIPRGDELFRDGAEVPAEEIESRTGRAAVFLGHPLGNFAKLDFTYAVAYDKYGRADDTAEGFVLPTDTLTHTFQTELSYNRSGYRVNLQGSYNKRSDWEFWGLPGNTEFDQEQEDYIRWQVNLAKTWWLPKFTKLGVELEHLDGEDLDRFSRYDFGIFGDASVAGYPGGLVRAEDADGVHVNYGLNAGELFRVEVEGDAVWVTSEDTGLDNELLAGVGLEGTLTLPWQMLVNFEIGQAVAGPADGIAARIVFLKLFAQK